MQSIQISPTPVSYKVRLVVTVFKINGKEYRLKTKLDQLSIIHELVSFDDSDNFELINITQYSLRSL